MNAEIKKRIDMINKGEVPEGYKKTKVGIIPEDWEVKRLREISKITMGQSPSSENYNQNGLGLPLIQGNADIKDRYTSPQIYTSEITKTCEVDDIIMTVRAPVGAIAKSIHEACIGRGVCSIRSVERDDYLFHYLIKNERMWMRYSQGSTFESVNSNVIKNFMVVKPDSNTEQQKIAQILSAWDKAIELKEKLIEEKKKQKKGLMQKLLTGEVRLPGFDGDWEEVRLGDIGQTFNGLTGKTSKDFGVGKPFITYKNIFANSRVDIKDVDYVKISEDENQNTTKYGDIFFTTSSETPDEVGMSSVLLDIVEELYLNSFCFGFRLNNFEILVPEYARFLFRGDVFRRKIFKLAQGSTRFNISKAEVLKLYIILPKINEQKAIAQILSTADKEIELLEKELEQLKLQKKGLMQLLLTGIIRVKS